MKDLTQEQIEKIPHYHEKWIKIGLDCGECDFEKAKEFARIVYEQAGEKCPDQFYLTDSPTACAKLAVKLRGIEENSEEYSSAFFTELNNQVFGSHESGWLTYYEFIWKEMGVVECEKLQGLMEIAKHVGWWAPYDTCVIFQHKHSEIHLDDQMRLHNETGPAVVYRDGTKVWAIGGIGLTEQIVMAPETLTIEQINRENNNEIRSVMINRFGWARYIKESNSTLLDFRQNDIENTMEALYDTEIFGKRLVVTCPTGRIFVLGAPDSVQTCEQAQAWLGSNEDSEDKVNVIART